MGDTPPTVTVLLVSASATYGKLIGKSLEGRFDLIKAGDAEQAWEVLLERCDISLVICELGLAVDSFGLLERVRSAGDSRLAAVPLLLLVSESDGDTSREFAFHQGATDFINMPFSSAELDARVRLHANLYQQQTLESTLEMKAVTAVNVLQRLSREKFFNSRVQQELSFSARHRSSLGLAKFRVDNIRGIVAGFDRAVATAVVQAVAKIAQETLRREDTLCYLGRADFAVLFPATNGIGASAGTARVLDRVAQRKIRIAGKRVPVTLSAAVFSCIADEDSKIDPVYALLDDGLARAEAQGGNQIVSCSAAAETRFWSIDQALKLVEAGESDAVVPQIDSLLLAVMPLIELADRSLDLDLVDTLAGLRDRLGAGQKPGA